MKICDLTQFYSPLSGGVKRYVQEKISFIQTCRPQDEHVLIIPGAKDETVASERSRIHSVSSPLVSRTTQYRVLLNLRAIDELIERERPDIIESADPYQIGWKAVRAGRAQRIPVIAFYHSHFPEAYLRGPARRLGRRGSELAMRTARAYVRKLYNRFEMTLVPSRGLAELLKEWGVANTRQMDLGVDTTVFRPGEDAIDIRAGHGIAPDRTLLLYVGRLAPEKNTERLFEAFAILAQRAPAEFHLLVIGDGQQREKLRRLQTDTHEVTWIPYCADSKELAQYYRAADLFVHPGVEETFGLVALESQACGTPVVGSRGSNMDDVILHGQEAWAIENTAVALAAAIEKMKGTNLASLGTSVAGLVAERYAWPRVFERLFSVYREVTSGYRKASQG